MPPSDPRHLSTIDHPPLSLLLLALLRTLLALLPAAILVAAQGSLQRLSSFGVASDVACEFEEVFLVLVLHCIWTDGEGTDELGEGEWSLILMFNSIVGENLLACFPNATSWVALGNVGQRTERKVWAQSSPELFHEVAPHESSRWVVREREVNLLVEELFELFFWALLGVACAADNGYTSFVIYKLSSPLTQRLLDSFGVRRIRLFLLSLLSFFTLLFGWPYFLTLIDVDYRWLELFGCHHHRSYHYIFFFLSLVNRFNVYRTQVKKNRVCFSNACSDNQCFSCTCGSIKKEGPYMLWVPRST